MARDQSRAAKRLVRLASRTPRAREHGTWSRVNGKSAAADSRPSTARSSVRGRTYVRRDSQISAPATRPRPGAWHRRWSFGASPRYLPSRAPMTGGWDGARIGGGARGARWFGSGDGAVALPGDGGVAAPGAQGSE